MGPAILHQELAALQAEARKLVTDYHDARHLPQPRAGTLARPEALTELPGPAEHTYRTLLRMAHHPPGPALLDHVRAAVNALRRQLF